VPQPTAPPRTPDQGRTVKKIFEIKQEGSRIRGRPKLRWLEDVEKYIQKMVECWRQKAFDREGRETVIMEVKTLRGL
jgi:hypothetical protein